MRFDTSVLRTVAILEGLPDSELVWLCHHGDKIQLSAGDRMFERGDPADYMFIVVSGTIEGYEEVGGQLLRVATTTAGQVTGMLPFSRMERYPRYTVAAEVSEVLRVRKREFPEMVTVSHELGRRLVAEMSNRVRGDVRLEQQQEKMAALGRLSAGLAHELNNPAAAIQRSAVGLAEELMGVGDLVSGLMRHEVDKTHTDAIDHLRHVADERRDERVTPLEQSQREEEMGEWLEERDAPRPWEVAANLADAGLRVADLDEFARSVPRVIQGDAVAWVACGLGVQRVVAEITSSAAHISDLVSSVKTYSHMDRSVDHKPTDVREGLDSTLTLLGHKLKRKNIRVSRRYPDDLPRISANAGELNQVWTNLIDNAIDAVNDGGTVGILVRLHEDHVHVDVVDDGHGIPADLRARIFEPFFTTKSVGQGTGLGLDIAMRIVRTHRGDVSVASQDGQTTFGVRLPVSPRTI